MPSAKSRDTAVQGIIHFLCTLLAVSIAATTKKPIWIDEVLSYAFAGFDSFPEMLRYLRMSFADLNVGQTGFLFVLNYWLLKIFGASYLTFRLPSYFAYGISIWAFLEILAAMALPLSLRLLFFLWHAFFTWTFLMALEARPYILIQGSAMAFLYFLLPTRKENFARGKGLTASLLFGILWHPYVPFYAGVATVGALMFFPAVRQTFRNHWLNRRFSLFAVSAIAVIITLTIGKFSWFQSLGRNYAFDPFYYLGHDRPLWVIVIGNLLAPIGKYCVGIIVLFGSARFFLYWNRGQRPWSALYDPYLAFFAFVLIVTQTIIVWQSLKSNYWILQRQWIAGFPIALLFFGRIVALALQEFPKARRILFAQAAWAFALVAVLSYSSWRLTENWKGDFTPKWTTQEYETAIRERLLPEIENISHYNLFYGGPVRRELANYYRRMDHDL